jgi:3-phenylpropionate/cinnamic acid dioxygenase small subunit
LRSQLLRRDELIARPVLDRAQAEDLLYAEALLLDESRYDEWLRMFTADALYWIPCNGAGGDPTREISIVYDNFPRLRDRVARLGTGMAHAQSPPSRTRRLISNVQVKNHEDGASTIVSAFILYELRRGKEHIYAGTYHHRFLIEDGSWKIALKKALLVNNDEVIDNLTFIV